MHWFLDSVSKYYIIISSHRKGILSCDAVSADVSDILQAMIDKVGLPVSTFIGAFGKPL